MKSALYSRQFSTIHSVLPILLYGQKHGNILRACISTVYKSWRRYSLLERKNGWHECWAGIACCRIKRSLFYGRSIKRSTVERTPLSGSNGAERNVISIPCASLITATLYLHRERNVPLRSFPDKRYAIRAFARYNYINSPWCTVKFLILILLILILK